MTSIAYSPVSIQTSAQSVPSTPDWFGEVTLISRYLQRQGVLTAIEEQVRFARRRFGRYEVIDFVAVLFGYAGSSERTLEAFYEHLQPWADAFMALFGRDRLPARATLSRFLAAQRDAYPKRNGSGTCFVAFIVCAERRNFSHIESRGNYVSEIAHEVVSCSTVCLLSSRCASCGLHGTQARRGGAEPYHDLAGPHSSVSGHVWKPWQRRVPS